MQRALQERPKPQPLDQQIPEVAPAAPEVGCLRGSPASGTELFQVICDRDMEGVVAKQASAGYTPEATIWVKIKNRHYSQAAGRQDFFNRSKAL